jgi:hypothetical protein
MFLDGANKKHYGYLLKQLQNDYLLGSNQLKVPMLAGQVKVCPRSRVSRMLVHRSVLDIMTRNVFMSD